MMTPQFRMMRNWYAVYGPFLIKKFFLDLTTLAAGLILVVAIAVAIYQLWPTITAFITGIF